MKKILYGLTIFISLFIATQSVEALNKCYYRLEDYQNKFYQETYDDKKLDDSEVYFSTQFFDSGVSVLSNVSFKGSIDNDNHIANAGWVINNWGEAHKPWFDTNFEAYYQTGECPKYLIYKQRNGDDWTYFSDTGDINLESNMFLLSNFSFSDIPSGTIRQGDCHFSVPVNGNTSNFTLYVDVDFSETDKEFAWYIITDGYVNNIHTGRGQDKITYQDFTLMFDIDQFQSNGKNYTIESYFEEYDYCPQYTFTIDNANTIALTAVDDSIPGIPMDTEVDDGFNIDFECNYTFYGYMDIKLQKSLTSKSRLCAKYKSDINYVCSNDWSSGLTLYNSALQDVLASDTALISFKDNVAANYSQEALNLGNCPNLELELLDNRYFYIEYMSDNLTSDKYKELLGSLKSPLTTLYPEALSWNLKLDGSDINLRFDITHNDEICKLGECNDAKYQTEKGLRNIKSYCNEIMRLDPIRFDSTEFNNRVEECNSFNDFYDRLVAEGIISNLAQGCGFISVELKEKMDWILDVIKIAGPILAIMLGMLDFLKVITAGDADKGMKDAWKKFQTRLIAAVLLFLVPVVLGILINTILPDEYIDEDPFCYVGN